MRTRLSRKRFIKKLYLAGRHLMLMPLLVFAKRVGGVPVSIRSAVVLRYDRIGDMVITTPLFQALKEQFPGVQLTVIASAVNQHIVSRNPNVDEIIVFQSYAQLRRLLRSRKIDLIIDPFYTYEMKQAYLCWRTGARYRLGFSCAGREVFFNLKGPRISGQASMHKHLARLAAVLGIDPGRYKPGLFLAPEEISWAQGYLDKQRILPGELKIAVHPGAHYFSQRWSPEGFVELTKRIISRYKAHIFLFGDRAEEHLLRDIQDKIWDERVTIFCDMNLRHVMALLDACDLLIGNNSGLLHIASAAGVPTVSAMGPTDPVLWQPWGEGHIVIRHALPCSPCSRGVCREHACMDGITCDEVEAAVRRQIERLGKGMK